MSFVIKKKFYLYPDWDNVDVTYSYGFFWNKRTKSLRNMNIAYWNSVLKFDTYTLVDNPEKIPILLEETVSEVYESRDLINQIFDAKYRSHQNDLEEILWLVEDFDFSNNKVIRQNDFAVGATVRVFYSIVEVDN